MKLLTCLALLLLLNINNVVSAQTPQVTSQNSPVLDDNLADVVNKLIKQEKWKEALLPAEQWIQQDAKNVNAWYAAGRAKLMSGSLDGAEIALSEALKLDPQKTEIWNEFGLLRKNQNRRVDAIEFFEHALQIDPKFFVAAENLGANLAILGRFAEAESAFLLAIEINEKSAFAWHNLAVLYQNSDNAEGAKLAFEKAIFLDSTNDNAVCGLGNILHTQGRFSEAMQVYRSGLESLPNAATIWDNMSNTLAAQGKLTEALDASKKATEIAPEFADAWNGLGRNYFKKKQLKLALQSFQQALKIDPDMADVWRNLTILYIATGDKIAKATSLARLRELDPDAAKAFD